MLVATITTMHVLATAALVLAEAVPPACRHRRGGCLCAVRDGGRCGLSTMLFCRGGAPGAPVLEPMLRLRGGQATFRAGKSEV